LRLAQGSVLWNVRHLDDDDSVEIDTPNLSFQVQHNGEYRINVDPDGRATIIDVFHGRGQALGGGNNYTVVANQQAIFRGGSDEDNQPLSYDIQSLPRDDDFDRWAWDRDRREDRSESASYVSREMTGYEDLDQYGRWSYDSTYGHVWIPTAVDSGWAPYRAGHWAFVAPWGWTWVDDAPWGFAPFHYGRWCRVRETWAWIPGPVVVRPVYAPALVAFVGGVARGQETYSERVERLAKMSDEEKIELQHKKERFDELSKETQEKLRALHVSITSDAKARELEETVKRYNQWLASLESPQRAFLLSIQNPKERITRIKELMQQQEERRFREFTQNLPEEDRKTISKWLEEFVSRHAEEIRNRLPDDMKKRVDEVPEESRRGELLRAWQQARMRDRNLPYPSVEETKELIPLLSPAAQSRVTAAPSASTDPSQTQDQVEHGRIVDLIRAVNFSRMFPHVSNEELLKFYQAMKSDDWRRERLEGLEKDKLYDELRRMWNSERYAKRGGPGGQRGGPGGPGGPRGEGGPRPPDGRGGFRPEDRRDGKGFGGKRPPDGKEFPPPPPPSESNSTPPAEKSDKS
jgi:hypothetical protein